MEIKSEKIIIELSNDEAWNIAFHIKHDLENRIEEHYIAKHHDSYNRGLEGHAKPLFEEQCRKSLNIMNQLTMAASGRDDLEKDLWHHLEKSYKKKHGNELN